MEYRRVGQSGLVVSVVGLGANNFGLKLDAERSREVLHAALDKGITLIDTSDSYGASEVRIGESLGRLRDDVVLATKFGTSTRNGFTGTADHGEDWGARASRRYIRRAVENSLRRLQTDWIDLYQIHCPEPETPIEETLSVLDDLVREGKIRYVGSSRFTGWQTAHAEWTARTRNLERFVSAQNDYSWLNRGVEADLVPALAEYGIGLLPYFPLANGLLTGKYRRGTPAPQDSRLQTWGQESLMTDRAFDVVEALEAFAAQRGVGLLDVALGGLAAKPTVASVIAGMTSPAQVRSNVAAFSWRPAPDDLLELDRLTG